MTERPLPDAAARAAIASDLDTTFLAEAGAGSGKTTSLVDRMVALIARGKATPEKLAAVTFTRKAAAQLRQRFQIALEEEARTADAPAAKLLGAARDNLDRCRIGTIHAFCASLLLERPIEAGLDPARLEVEQQEAEHLSARVFTEWIESRLAAEDATLTRLLSLGVRVDDLECSFRTLLEFPDVAPVVGPERPRPGPIRSTTAIGRFPDLRRRRSADGSTGEVGTPFNERYGKPCANATSLPSLRTPALRATLPDFEGSPDLTQNRWTTGLGSQVKRRAESLRPVIEQALFAWRQFLHPLAIRILDPAVAAAVRARREQGLLAYEDLLLLTRDLLRDRPAVRRYFKERLSHLLVDEFQDTDPLQAELLLLLTASASDAGDVWKLTPEPGSLFVVGDPKQSIYRFRRADIALYERFKSRILAGHGQVLLLTASFRSAPALAKTLNKVLKEILPLVPSETQAAWAPLESVQPEPRHVHGAFRMVTTTDSRRDAEAVDASADQIARWISWAIGGGFKVSDPEKGGSRTAKAQDFLLLTRRKKHVSTYARALQARGIAVDVSGSEGFSISEGLRALRPLLSAALDPGDEVSVVAFLTGPLSGIDDSALYAFRKAGGRFSANAAPPAGCDPRLVRGMGLLRAAAEDVAAAATGRRARAHRAAPRRPSRACLHGRRRSFRRQPPQGPRARPASVRARWIVPVRRRASRPRGRNGADLEEMSLSPARLDAVQAHERASREGSRGADRHPRRAGRAGRRAKADSPRLAGCRRSPRMVLPNPTVREDDHHMGRAPGLARQGGAGRALRDRRRRAPEVRRRDARARDVDRERDSQKARVSFGAMGFPRPQPPERAGAGRKRRPRPGETSARSGSRV